MIRKRGKNNKKQWSNEPWNILYNPHSVAFEPANAYLESKRDDQGREKLTDKDKKKKVANKKDNASRGLKYINPSQEITPRFTNNSCMLVWSWWYYYDLGGDIIKR